MTIDHYAYQTMGTTAVGDICDDLRVEIRQDALILSKSVASFELPDPRQLTEDESQFLMDWLKAVFDAGATQWAPVYAAGDENPAAYMGINQGRIGFVDEPAPRDDGPGVVH